MARYAAWLNGLVTADLVARDLLVEAPLVHPAAVIRRAALESAGGWRDGPFPEDYDLWLRLSAAGGRLTNVPRTLLWWRESPQRLTRTDPRYAIARHVALKCAFLVRHVLEGRNEVAVWGAGETGRAFADALGAEGVRVALFVEVDRKKIGRTVRGAAVVSYEEVHRARGLPLDYVFPAGGTVVIDDAIGLVRGARHAEAAKRFIDWAATDEALLLAARLTFRLPARTDLPKDSVPPWIADVESRMREAPMDWALLAREGPAWMAYWDQRVRGSGKR